LLLSLRRVCACLAKLADFCRRLIALGFHLLRFSDTLPAPAVQLAKSVYVQRIAACCEALSNVFEMIPEKIEIVHP
jgi:hypothetical protein